MAARFNGGKIGLIEAAMFLKYNPDTPPEMRQKATLAFRACMAQVWADHLLAEAFRRGEVAEVTWDGAEHFLARVESPVLDLPVASMGMGHCPVAAAFQAMTAPQMVRVKDDDGLAHLRCGEHVQEPEPEGGE